MLAKVQQLETKRRELAAVRAQLAADEALTKRGELHLTSGERLAAARRSDATSGACNTNPKSSPTLLPTHTHPHTRARARAHTHTHTSHTPTHPHTHTHMPPPPPILDPRPPHPIPASRSLRTDGNLSTYSFA